MYTILQEIFVEEYFLEFWGYNMISKNIIHEHIPLPYAFNMFSGKLRQKLTMVYSLI